MEKLDYSLESKVFKTLMSQATEKEGLIVLLQIIHIIDKLHLAGLYNSDLKPDNIMIEKKDSSWDGQEIKLIDLGGIE